MKDNFNIEEVKLIIQYINRNYSRIEDDLAKFFNGNLSDDFFDAVYKLTFNEAIKSVQKTENFKTQRFIVDKHYEVLPMLLDCRNILKQCESTTIDKTCINIKIIQIDHLIQSLISKEEWNCGFINKIILT